MDIKSKIRTGQVEVDYAANCITFLDQRFYKHEPTGNWVPSETTVLGNAYPKDPMLIKWMKEQGTDSDLIMQEAAEHGSIVHKLTEDYDKGIFVSALDDNGNPKFTSKEWKHFERYVDFSKKYTPIVHHIELQLVDEQSGGTMDRDIEIEIGGVKKRLIIDIKTSNNLHDSYWIQLARYREKHEKLNSIKADDMGILWLNAKTRTEGKKDAVQGKGWQLVFPPKEYQHYLKLWTHTKALYDEQFGDMKPNLVTYQLSYQK